MSAQWRARMTVVDTFRVAYRWRWLAATILAVVMAGAIGYVTWTVPTYEAQVKILIESDTPNVVEFEELLDQGETQANYYQTQYELLRSRALARRTVEALSLGNRPGFLEKATPGVRRFGGDAAVTSGPVGTRGATGTVLGHLFVTPVRGTRIVNVRYQAADPALAAEVANAHARQYVEQALEIRYLMSQEATEWLATQLAAERKRVEESESALQAFREQHDAISLEDGQNIVVQKLADLNAAVTRVKTGRIEKEAQYRQMLAAESNPALLDSFPAIIGNAFIQQLKADLAKTQRELAQAAETLGPQHPVLLEKRASIATTEQRLQAEVQRIAQSVANEYRTARVEEDELTRALAAQKTEALALNRRGIEYAALEREAASIRIVYESLLQRAKETGVSSELRATNIRIIDEAEAPRTAVAPRRGMALLLALLAGACLAAAAVFAAQIVDDRITTPDDVQRAIGLECLGLLPEVDATSRADASLLAPGTPSPFLEAMRALRTSVIALSGECRTLMIASAATGDGKTLVSTSLAMALAQTGQRVLLIDADLRCPGVHDIVGCDAEPGVSAVLAGRAAIADAIRPTRVAGLQVLPAGSFQGNTPELLASPACAELFREARKRFDWVIIDSPPLLNVADGAVIATHADGVIFVVGAARRRAHALAIAIEDLRRAGGHIIGAVLNRADLKHHSFYYGPYSRQAYGPVVERTPQLAGTFLSQ